MEASACYHQHMGSVWKAPNGWTHPYSKLWSPEARQGRRTRNPPGLSLFPPVSLGREAHHWRPPLNPLLHPYTHSPVLHKLSPRSTKTCMSSHLVFHMFTPKPKSVPPKKYSKVDLSITTNKVACNSQLSAPPAPSSTTQEF